MRSALFAAMIAFSVQASAQEAQPWQMTGLQLKKFCNGELGDWGDGGCLLYIVGMSEGIEYGSVLSQISTGQFKEAKAAIATAKEVMKICRPLTATNEQAVLVVRRFLDEHPERLHESAKFLVPAAFSEAFPCS